MSEVFVVSPVYNEVESVGPFCEELKRVSRDHLSDGHHVTAILIDDGSHDGSYDKIIEQPSGAYCQFVGIQLSRNFGQQAAIQAGLEQAFEMSKPGDCFVILDSDLQHPPELIPKMIEALENGADHVQMQRADSQSLSVFKNLSSRLFYKLFQKLTRIQLKPGSSDFRAFSHSFLKAYLRLKEKGRFNRGLFYWVGFKREEIEYQPHDREYGESKYSVEKMVSLAVSGISQFSSKPLIIGTTLITAFSFLIVALYFGYEIVNYMAGKEFVLGWTSLIAIVTFWGGATSLGQLLTAVYVSRIFEEVKARPNYLVKQSSVELAAEYAGDDSTQKTHSHRHSA